MGRAKSIAVVALCMMGWLAGGAAQAQEDAASILKSWQTNVNLIEWRENKGRDFWDEMAFLYDEEHASDSPHRLPLFDQMLERDDRDPEVDYAVLAPWLYRYIWVEPYPNYTEGAVRAFRRLDIDGDIIDAAMIEILANHPHGQARAATLEYDEYVYQSWLEAPRFQRLVEHAMTEDPAPKVRAAAFRQYDLQAFMAANFDRLVERINADPSPYVRATAVAALAEVTDVNDPAQLARWDAAVEQELSRAENGWLLPGMLRTYLRKGGHHNDLDRAAFGLNLLHQHREAPFYKVLLDQMGSQMDEFTAEALVEFAPFEGEEALAVLLHELFTDEEQPMVLRSMALEELAEKRPGDLSLPQIHGFVMHEAHTQESLEAFCTGFWQCGDAVRMILVHGAAGMMPEVSSRFDLVSGLLDHFMADQNGAPRATLESQTSLIKTIVRLENGVVNPDAHEEIKAKIIDIVATSEDYMIYGIHEWIENRDVMSDDEIIRLAQRLKNVTSLSQLGDSLADRMAPGPFEDPVPQGRDLHVAAAVVTEMDKRVVEGAEIAPGRLIYDMFWYGIPKMAELDPDLDGLAELEAAMRHYQRHGTEEDPIGIILSWLGEG